MNDCYVGLCFVSLNRIFFKFALFKLLKYLLVCLSLGSTRFMKVARVDHAEGPSVLKVFILQDPSFSIDLYRDQVFVSLFSLL